MSDTISSGPAYCVRLCDGRYFPINQRSGNAAALCNSFCPAATTQIFSGSDLRYAVASDGKRYSQIPNAFVYRSRLIPDCTCDGKSPAGLVPQKAENDSTLQSGDIVATENGLMAYRGDSGRSAEFTPLDGAALSPVLRKQLSTTRVQLPPVPAKETVGSGEAPAISRNVDQRGQASR